MESRSRGLHGPRQRAGDWPRKRRLGLRRPPQGRARWGGAAGLCTHGILGHQDVPGLNRERCRSKSGDPGRGLKCILLFRLEKVYNLVKETLPKKPDGQSGVRGASDWAGP